MQAASEQLCCVFAAKCSFLGYFCWEVPAASALFQEEKGQKWEKEIAEAMGSSQLRAVPCVSPRTDFYTRTPTQLILFPLCLHSSEHPGSTGRGAHRPAADAVRQHAAGRGRRGP